ncbi:hypothetical protein PVAND_001812 [Polypedilum vanderplanki]|uniref:Chemosensory protein n=1 Tax=Polypedilum vanderplanki TaxID=319348 RepID=A0A9J6BQC2_POLVA|nr:hypothetical protein PVAND_001812 [Polypedilum vanderplanki]
MRSNILICVTFLATVVIGIYGQNSKLENFDIDTILKNDRILNNYLKCLLDKGPCTNEGRELKKALPETLETNCAKCSDKQRRQTRKLIDHLENKKPQLFKQVQAKFDPTGEYTRNFKALNN